MDSLKLAYEAGVKLAMQEAGLVKEALLPEAALLGGGIGALGGGLSEDSSIGRGALRGAGAGLGAVGGAGMGTLLAHASKNPKLKAALLAAGVLGGGIAGGVGGHAAMRAAYPNQTGLSKLLEGSR
jgi:hypothetical protein